MKIVVIGGNGLIGSKLVKKLSQLTHEIISASPSSGVNTVTGEGLTAILKDAQVVVDVSNSPSFEKKAAVEFFQNSGNNLLAGEIYANVQHHVALSIVGADRFSDHGYFYAKKIQEALIRESGIPYSILHSTQFFELFPSIVESGSIGEEVHISPGLFQPVAAADVVKALYDIVLGTPIEGDAVIGGPERSRMDDFIGRYLQWTHDPRRLVSNKHARFFGEEITDQLVPRDNPLIGELTFEKWFERQEVMV